jgi:hypothetical protein
VPKGKSRWLQIFDRAFEKAARLLPGQASNLTEEEDAVLLDAIQRYQQRQEQAFQRFLHMLKEQEYELSRQDAKLLFKQLCLEGKIVC